MGRTGEARQAYAVSLGLARSAAEAGQMRIYIDRLKQKP
jgi:predicted RNA polymerase sigma factor